MRENIAFTKKAYKTLDRNMGLVSTPDTFGDHTFGAKNLAKQILP
jgi:hypothetical protein